MLFVFFVIIYLFVFVDFEHLTPGNLIRSALLKNNIYETNFATSIPLFCFSGNQTPDGSDAPVVTETFVPYCSGTFIHNTDCDFCFLSFEIYSW